MSSSGSPDFEAQIQEMTSIATHPAMLNVLKQIEQAPPGQKFDVAKGLATREALAAAGLELPPEGRVSMREFEDKTQHAVKTEEVLAPPTITPAVSGNGGTWCTSVGYIVCVSYGS